MSTVDPPAATPEHPWRGIDLDVYERHMSDARVGQLQQLHEITGEQLSTYPGRTVGYWGSPEATDSTSSTRSPPKRSTATTSTVTTSTPAKRGTATLSENACT